MKKGKLYLVKSSIKDLISIDNKGVDTIMENCTATIYFSDSKQYSFPEVITLTTVEEIEDFIIKNSINENGCNLVKTVYNSIKNITFKEDYLISLKAIMILYKSPLLKKAFYDCEELKEYVKDS